MLELVIVMVLLTVMTAVAVPYATRSKKGLQLNQMCADLAELAKYAVDRAAQKGQTVRLVIDFNDHTFVLEAAKAEGQELKFKPLQEAWVQNRPFPSDARLVSIQGFDALDTNQYGLTFDPRQPWPLADVSLEFAGDSKIVRIEGRRIYVTLQETGGLQK